MKFQLKYPIAPWTPNQKFGENHLDYKKLLGINGHNGIDISCKDGTPIYAAHDGIITYSGEDGAGGLTIVLRTLEQYDYGETKSYYKTIYCHLKKGSFVFKSGDKVRCGDKIAEANNTGMTTSTHLHFGLKPLYKGEKDWEWYNADINNGYKGAIDPMPFFTGEYAFQTNIYKFTSTMRFGQKSLDIGRLQSLLQKLGYFPKEQPPTGYYGNETRKAVLAFQYQNNVASFSELYALQGTICGQKTIAKLNQI